MSPSTPTSSSSSPAPDSSEALVVTSPDFDAGQLVISKSPQLFVQTSTGILSVNDLRLVHHYSTSTWQTIGVHHASDPVLQISVPQLAFQHGFLLDAMLGMTLLHIQYLSPNSESAGKEIAVYRSRAISRFREALEGLNRESKNYEALLLMALLVILLTANDSVDGDLAVIRWLKLYQGIRYIMEIRQGDLSGTQVEPIFIRDRNNILGPPLIPSELLNMLACLTFDDPDYQHLHTYSHILDALGLLYASLHQDGPTEPTLLRIVTWCSFASAEFCILVKERRPRAFVICAYYMTFVKLIEGLWWAKGAANRDILAISQVLGQSWLPMLDIPLQAIQMNNIGDITNLLLR